MYELVWISKEWALDPLQGSLVGLYVPQNSKRKVILELLATPHNGPAENFLQLIVSCLGLVVIFVLLKNYIWNRKI